MGKKASHLGHPVEAVNPGTALVAFASQRRGMLDAERASGRVYPGSFEDRFGPELRAS